MLWDNETDSDDMQRLKNLAFLKMPFTNKERDDAMPGMCLLLVALVVIMVLVATAVHR